MKDEYNSRPIAEYVGLRAKMYSVKEANGSERKKAKGISKRTTAHMLHDCYLAALYEEKSTLATMQRIASKNHTVTTVSVTKTGLSPYDDKRFVLDDKISTLAYGHYKITG